MHLDGVSDFTALPPGCMPACVGAQDCGDLSVGRVYAWYGHVARMSVERSRPAVVALHSHLSAIMAKGPRKFQG